MEAWVRLGSQQRAIEALIALEKQDPARHQDIVGRPHPMGYDTYRDYIKLLPDEVREAAREAARQRGKSTR